MKKPVAMMPEKPLEDTLAGIKGVRRRIDSAHDIVQKQDLFPG